MSKKFEVMTDDEGLLTDISVTLANGWYRMRISRSYAMIDPEKRPNAAEAMTHLNEQLPKGWN